MSSICFSFLDNCIFIVCFVCLAVIWTRICVFSTSGLQINFCDNGQSKMCFPSRSARSFHLHLGIGNVSSITPRSLKWTCHPEISHNLICLKCTPSPLSVPCWIPSLEPQEYRPCLSCQVNFCFFIIATFQFFCLKRMFFFFFFLGV